MAGPGRPGQRRHDRAHRGGADRGGLRGQPLLRPADPAVAEARARPAPSTATGSPISASRTSTDATHSAIEARVRVDGGQVYAPAISDYPFASEEIGTPSVRSRLTEDIYLTLARTPAKAGDPAVIGVIVEPLVMWIWIGGGIMLAGTLLAAWPGRRRRPTDPVSAPVGAATPAADLIVRSGTASRRRCPPAAGCDRPSRDAPQPAWARADRPARRSRLVLWISLATAAVVAVLVAVLATSGSASQVSVPAAP